MNRSQYILVAIAALLALSVFTIALFSFFRPAKQESEQAPIATPTQTPLPEVTYDQSSSDKMLDLIENRTPFNSVDAAARSSLIEQSETTPYIYSSKNVRVEYLSAPDQFMAEILGADVTAAKVEAVSFFLTAGLSTDAICHLPLVFYLGADARRSLPKNPPAFNPLPDNC